MRNIELLSFFLVSSLVPSGVAPLAAAGESRSHDLQCGISSETEVVGKSRQSHRLKACNWSTWSHGLLGTSEVSGGKANGCSSERQLRLRGSEKAHRYV